MYIEIKIDTREPMSDQDKGVLAALAGAEVVAGSPAEATKPATPGETTPTPTPAKKAAAPAKKAAAAPAKKAAAPAKEAPEPDQPDSPAMAKALSLTSDLLSADGRPKVLKALKAVGSPKASEVPEDKLEEYIGLLEADDE